MNPNRGQEYARLAHNLEFLLDRLEHKHHENPSCDYMIVGRQHVARLRALSDCYAALTPPNKLRVVAKVNGAHVEIITGEKGNERSFVFYANSKEGADLLAELLAQPVPEPPPAPISSSQLIAFETGNLISDIKNIQEVVKSLDCVTQRRHDALLARVQSLTESNHNSREAFKAELDKLAVRVSELEQRDPKCLFDTLTEKIADLDRQRRGQEKLESVMLNRIHDLERKARTSPPEGVHDPERIDKVLTDHAARLMTLERNGNTVFVLIEKIREKFRKKWGDYTL